MMSAIVTRLCDARDFRTTSVASFAGSTFNRNRCESAVVSAAFSGSATFHPGLVRCSIISVTTDPVSLRAVYVQAARSSMSQQVDLGRWELTAPLPVVQLTGWIVWKDGSPAAGVYVSVADVTGNPIGNARGAWRGFERQLPAYSHWRTTVVTVAFVKHTSLIRYLPPLRLQLYCQHRSGGDPSTRPTAVVERPFLTPSLLQAVGL